MVECRQTGISMKANHMWRARMVTDIPESNGEFWIHFATREAIEEWLDDPTQNDTERMWNEDAKEWFEFGGSRDGTTRRERLIKIEAPREVIE